MASGTVTNKLIEMHHVEGRLEVGEEIGIRIDQTLTQDATGTLAMLELEAMGVERVRTEVSAQYVDHNIIQEDFKNPDDHLFLRSACRRFGLWFSPAGNGVSHPVHMARLGIPGKTMLGSDSHTCAAGSIGMLAIGAGGLEVTMAMAGQPFHFQMPQIWGVELIGALPDWVSAKDVILELLRRHGVDGGIQSIVEYRGSGLANLTAMDRHVIANMGAELGATTSVFPSDEQTRRFFRRQGREKDWVALLADDDARYDIDEQIDLSKLEPLVARPSSPGNVVPVRDAAGEVIYQSYVGSSANPGFRDFAVVAEVVRNRKTHRGVSFDVNPTSREILENLIAKGYLGALVHAGARIHQAGCNGCIGMGQAPATGRNSLRTVPRNFPGRSGTREDTVWLCSPETAAASALTGVISDPRDVARDLGLAYPRIEEPDDWIRNADMLEPPVPAGEAKQQDLVKGPNIVSLPVFAALPDELRLPVILHMGDDVSTDEILPAGTRVLPYRSNIPKISEFAFDMIDRDYPRRARETRADGGHAVVAGDNYGQGSSREHAALAPRYLGLRMALAKRFARIHWQNLVNFGVLPLTFAVPGDYETVVQGDVFLLRDLRATLARGGPIVLTVERSGLAIRAVHTLSERQVDVVLAGGLIDWTRQHSR
jgi:aconitate hydratase